MINRQAQRKESFTGIWGINEQDRALQESMPSIPGDQYGIADRSGEHLVKSDYPTMFARRKLTKLARDLAEGKEPVAALRSEQYGLRAIAKVSTIADFDEFMVTHGDEAKALGGSPGTDSAVRPATLS
jgi:hypothetical protein